MSILWKNSEWKKYTEFFLNSTLYFLNFLVRNKAELKCIEKTEVTRRKLSDKSFTSFPRINLHLIKCKEPSCEICFPWDELQADDEES